MNDADFLAHMSAAAANRNIVTGEEVDRLRALAGSSMAMRMPSGWVGTVDPANVEWAVSRATKLLRA